jgi:hypothetical protein
VALVGSPLTPAGVASTKDIQRRAVVGSRADLGERITLEAVIANWLNLGLARDQPATKESTSGFFGTTGAKSESEDDSILRVLGWYPIQPCVPLEFWEVG